MSVVDEDGDADAMLPPPPQPNADIDEPKPGDTEPNPDDWRDPEEQAEVWNCDMASIPPDGKQDREH